MTITKQQARDAYTAVSSMRETKPNSAVYGLTINKGRWKVIVDAIDAQRIAIGKSHFGDVESVSGDDPRIKAFTQELEAMLSETVEYNAEPINATARELQADGLSPNGLEALLPFLNQEDKTPPSPGLAT